MRVIGFLLATLALTTVCADQTFRIVANKANEAFLFNISGFPDLLEDPALNVTVGEIITFRIESLLDDGIGNAPHPFGLTEGAQAGGSVQDFTDAAHGSLTPSASCTKATDKFGYYTTNVSNPCILTWTVYQPTQLIFYVCSKHIGMTAQIEVKAAAGGNTTPPPTGNGTTTSPPTSSGGTTPVPTTTAPPTSTGKNDAAVILPGAAAFIIAAINALFA